MARMVMDGVDGAPPDRSPHRSILAPASAALWSMAAIAQVQASARGHHYDQCMREAT